MNNSVKVTAITKEVELDTAILNAREAIYIPDLTERVLIEDNETGEVLFDYQNGAVQWATNSFMQKLLNFHSWGAK